METLPLPAPGAAVPQLVSSASCALLHTASCALLHTAPGVPSGPGALATLSDLAEEARDYLRLAKAGNTLRAYRSDWRQFSDWCSAAGLPSLPASAETLALYLTAHAKEHKTSTLRRRLTAIGQAHAAAGHESPTKHPAVSAVWAGIRRTHGTAQEGKAPTLTADIAAMCALLPDTLLGTRDRALLLLGFAGAFRRSELVALDMADLQRSSSGLVVTIRRSKTDQEGAGRKVGIPHGERKATCPVKAVVAWTKAAGIEEGALFRSVDRHGKLQPSRLSAQSVALIVKRRAAAAGKDPALYAGHSLRAGLATSAAIAGVEEAKIQEQTGHRSVTMLRRYVREGSLFRGNAAGRVGL